MSDKVTFKVAVIRSCALYLQATSVDLSLDYKHYTTNIVIGEFTCVDDSTLQKLFWKPSW